MKRFGMLVGALALATLALAPGSARAHCDALDGPVVTAAKRALETGKFDPVRPWLLPAYEAEAREAFAEALEVRKLGPKAKALADRSFFETVVRVHRAGEGAPYTGLKAAGRDLGPAIPAADRSIEQGSPAEVERLLVHAVKEGLARRFAAFHGHKAPPADATHGRHWVAAYVDYVHYVEGLHAAAGAGGAHGGDRAAAAPACGHEGRAGGDGRHAEHEPAKHAGHGH